VFDIVDSSEIPKLPERHLKNYAMKRDQYLKNALSANTVYKYMLSVQTIDLSRTHRELLSL